MLRRFSFFPDSSDLGADPQPRAPEIFAGSFRREAPEFSGYFYARARPKNIRVFLRPRAPENFYGSIFGAKRRTFSGSIASSIWLRKRFPKKGVFTGFE